MGITGERAKTAPLLLFAAFPTHGNFHPIWIIASYLSTRGYETIFLATEPMRSKVEDIGAEWLEFPDSYNPEAKIKLQGVKCMPMGLARRTALITHALLDSLPQRCKRLAEVLELLHSRCPSRQIIFIEDILNMSILPYKYGRPLPNGLDKMPSSMGISPLPLLLDSEDTGPSILGLPPDSSLSGRLRNRIISQLFRDGPMKPLMDTWMHALRHVGCTQVPEADFFTARYTAHDIVVQLCSPSLEYPRSDLPPSIHFVGVLPRQDAGDFKYPQWWADITGSKIEPNENKVLFVSQGTLNLDYSELIIPTIKAFGGCGGVLVIVALGVHGGTLPKNLKLPDNVRVIDYVPYDLILEFTDVFVTNAGYGGLTHAIRNGVPVVLAGEAEDKADVALRAVFAGVGVNLKTQTPTPQDVRAGVEEILRNPEYQRRATELRDESVSYNSLATIERMIEELTE